VSDGGATGKISRAEHQGGVGCPREESFQPSRGQGSLAETRVKILTARVKKFIKT